MLLRRRDKDIESGRFYFGERIALGRICKRAVEQEAPDIEIAKDVIECLHDIRVSSFAAKLLMRYVERILNSFMAWMQREDAECYVPPQQEAMQAGVKTFAEEAGDMAAVVDLAEKYGWTFEQVYRMPYMDVFAIWKVEAAKARYQRRLDKVIESKIKSKSKSK